MENITSLIDRVSDKIESYETSIARLASERDELIKAGEALYNLLPGDKKSSAARKKWEELTHK